MLGVEARHLEDVRAADEGLLARTGQHHRTQVVALRQRRELAHKRDHQMAVERVELGGVLDRHARDDAGLALVHEHFDGGCGHGLPFCGERGTAVSG